MAESMIVPEDFEGPLLRGFEKRECKTVGPGLAYGAMMGKLSTSVMRTLWRNKGLCGA